MWSLLNNTHVHHIHLLFNIHLHIHVRVNFIFRQFNMHFTISTIKSLTLASLSFEHISVIVSWTKPTMHHSGWGLYGGWFDYFALRYFISTLSRKNKTTMRRNEGMKIQKDASKQRKVWIVIRRTWCLYLHCNLCYWPLWSLLRQRTY